MCSFFVLICLGPFFDLRSSRLRLYVVVQFLFLCVVILLIFLIFYFVFVFVFSASSENLLEKRRVRMPSTSLKVAQTVVLVGNLFVLESVA